MNLKLLFCVFLCFVQIAKSQIEETEDDLSDFDFNSEDGNPSEEEEGIEGFGNDVEYEEEIEPKPQVIPKDEQVRQVILNSMKSKDMRDKVARVLPILRVMTPDQKLALASLVTTQVLAPPSKELTLEEVANLFGSNPNTTAELMLPISLDVANMFRRGRSEKGPSAEELRQPYKRPYRRNTLDRGPPLHLGGKHPLRPRKPIHPSGNGGSKDPPNCELFSAGICLKSHDYPIDAIMSSIRRNKHAMAALLTDFKGMTIEASTEGILLDEETQTNEDDLSNEVRRTGGDSGYMCPSQIRYARPQKARSTNGQWKYIVNTPEHTQTLRLERCLKSGDTCTYLTDNFKSRCLQVYNYHRLLTWDQTNGLHMDIFKVPTCCSCHIDSYKVPFPPHHANHATTSESFPGDDLDREPSSTTPIESHYIPNVIPGSSLFKDSPHQTIDFSETNYHQESTKIRPAIEPRPAPEHRPSLPKYLEAPKPQPGLTKPGYNGSFKRSNTPKPFGGGGKRPGRPVRRRLPSKPVRDLAQSESNFGQFTTEFPSSTVSSLIKDHTRKINYNYHPIIDFFKPDQLESRMDTDFGSSDWRPVTSMLLATVTERTQYQK